MKTETSSPNMGLQADNAANKLKAIIAENWFTRKQLQDALSISSSTLKRIQDKQHLRPVVLGKRQLIHQSEVDRLLASYTEDEQ